MKTTNIEAIRIAHRKGYRIDEIGNIRNRHGLPVKARDHKGYLYFRIKLPKSRKNGTILVHRLQAYQKFGEAMFEPGLEVRHLNNDSHNNSAVNIGIGTHTENMNDLPKEVRIRAALKGADAVRKWDHAAIAAFYRVSKSYRKTMAHFGIRSTGTLHFILNKSLVSVNPLSLAA